MIRNNGAFIAILISMITSIHNYANDTLYLPQFLDVVTENHPLIQKANLNDEIAAAQRLKGKGTLDPKVSSDYNSKKFDDTQYFKIWRSEATIPTVLPIDFSVGYERNDGVFLNNENTVPDNGLVYGTINLSLLRGLIFDEQRYGLLSSELKALKSEIDKKILTREIIYQAINSYLDWALKSSRLEGHQNYLTLVKERHQNVIELFENGDRPAMDTIESRLNINSAEKLVLESRNQLVKSSQNLSLFIWNKRGQALELISRIKPSKLESLIEELRELAIITIPHFNGDPIIAKIENRIESIELENKLEKEYLKPRLDVKYNAILNLGKATFEPTFTLNDYKYAVSFQLPILNRKSKGELRYNDARAAQYGLDKIQYLGRLNNKFEALSSQKEIQYQLLRVTNEKYTNSALLYNAENLKFALGESSVFLLNSRERKLLEAQLDILKSYYSLGKIYSELYFLKVGQDE